MNKTAILDCDSIAYKIANGNKVLDEFGVPLRTEDGSKFIYTEKTQDELAASADFIINQILNKCGCDSYIGFVKGVNTIEKRKIINIQYKANRILNKPKWWDFVKKYLIDNYNIYEANDYEVDDYVNSCKYLIPNSFIVAIDKDLLSLESINPHYNWKKNEWINVTKEEEIYAFAVDMITGQPGDNIKGIKNKGVKFAEKLLNNTTQDLYLPLILKEYILEYGENEGISNFYINYNSLKLLTNIENFICPPIKEFGCLIE